MKNSESNRTVKLNTGWTFILLSLVVLILASCASTRDSEERELAARQELNELQQSYEALEAKSQEQDEEIQRLQDELQRENSENTELMSQLQQARNGQEQLQTELQAASQRIQVLSSALNESQFALQLFSAADVGDTDALQSSNSTENSGETGATVSGNHNAETASTTGGRSATESATAQADSSSESGPAQVRDVFSSEAISRQDFRSIEGSNLESQAGLRTDDLYISHSLANHSMENPVYLEIRQEAGSGLGLFLVLQNVQRLGLPAMDIYGADLTLGGSFVLSLDEFSRKELLNDPSRSLERIYVPMNQRYLQALGNMIVERRGLITIKGRTGEREVIMDRQLATIMQEVLAAFIEIQPAFQ